MSELVLLHGVGLDHRMWHRCLRTLRARHRVRALDLLGHGSSAPAPVGAELADLAGDVADRLNEPAHLVGFSLGALVAQQVALDHPAMVRSLVLVSPVAARSPAESAAVAQRLAVAERDFPAAVSAALDRWMPSEWQVREPELARELRATLLGNDPDSYLTCYRIFSTADQALWPRLPEITAPTLVITGAEDSGSTPEMAHRLAGAIPAARALVVPGVRHLLPLQDPHALTENVLAHTQEVDHGVTTSQPLHRR